MTSIERLARQPSFARFLSERVSAQLFHKRAAISRGRQTGGAVTAAAKLVGLVFRRNSFIASRRVFGRGLISQTVIGFRQPQISRLQALVGCDLGEVAAFVCKLTKLLWSEHFLL